MKLSLFGFVVRRYWQASMDCSNFGSSKSDCDIRYTQAMDVANIILGASFWQEAKVIVKIYAPMRRCHHGSCV